MFTWFFVLNSLVLVFNYSYSPYPYTRIPLYPIPFTPPLPHACAFGNYLHRYRTNPSCGKAEHQAPGVTNSPQGGVAACRILAAKARVDADGVVRRMLIPEQSSPPIPEQSSPPSVGWTYSLKVIWFNFRKYHNLFIIRKKRWPERHCGPALAWIAKHYRNTVKSLAFV